LVLLNVRGQKKFEGGVWFGVPWIVGFLFTGYLGKFFVEVLGTQPFFK
jgi:hypothetical protein